MNKFFRGIVVLLANSGAVQFVRNREAEKDFLLVTTRNGDFYIPVNKILKALESQWDADNEERQQRYNQREGSEDTPRLPLSIRQG